MTSARRGSTPSGPLADRAAARLALLALLGCTWLPAPPAWARTLAGADSVRLPEPGPPIARFERAVDLETDPRGGVLVLDGSAGTLVRVGPSGRRETLLAVGATDDPSEPRAFDPTNGQTVLVADGARGAVSWYTRSGRLLERRPVRTRAEEGGPVGRWDRQDPSLRAEGDGRPASVAATGSGWTYVLETVSGTVLLWDDRGEEVRRVRPSAEGEETAPIDLAYHGGRLYLLDRSGSVRTYDRTGRKTGRIALRPDVSGTSRSVHADASGLLVTFDRVLVHTDPETGATTVYHWRGTDPAVDALMHAGELHVLTGGGLYRLPLPGIRVGDRTR